MTNEKMKINFNDFHIVKGYIGQLIPQMGLDDKLKGVIRVGFSGELSYPLFDPKFAASLENLSHGFKDESSVNSILTLSQNLKFYLGESRETARRYGCDLLSLEDYAVGAKGKTYLLTSLLKNVGIGNLSIDSAQQIVIFLKMVKENHEPLKQAYTGLQTSFEEFSKIRWNKP